MDKVYAKSENISSKKIENEVLIVPIDNKINPNKPELFYLEDPTSVKIWELINGKRALSQIIEEISTLFNIEKDRVKDDILNFILELKDDGIILEKG